MHLPCHSEASREPLRRSMCHLGYPKLKICCVEKVNFDLAVAFNLKIIVLRVLDRAQLERHTYRRTNP